MQWGFSYGDFELSTDARMCGWMAWMISIYGMDFEGCDWNSGL